MIINFGQHGTTIMEQLCENKLFTPRQRFPANSLQSCSHKQACKCSFLSIHTFTLCCHISAIYYFLITPWLCFFPACTFKVALINTDEHKWDEKCWVQAYLLHKYKWKHFSQSTDSAFRLQIDSGDDHYYEFQSKYSRQAATTQRNW